ncbi:hypothetical protein [Shewanella algae]|uniref:Uncharacterized protein n=1 Tax=Shewanella algae TaxID=38313 RepID=A0A7T8E987_9GAMM|nr:hypothetical protein [Shewanella algae]QQO82125.1 hypothetical protein D7032_01970 [Shewanella algae]
MDDTIVSLSEQAFFTIVTAALEAYKVDHSKLEDGSEVRLETFGNLWGHSTKHNRSVVYHVSYADVSTSASREKVEVTPNDQAYNLKKEFVDYFFPEMSHLGDYHSHPYSVEDGIKSELKLERDGFHKFSPGDFKAVRAEHKKKRDYRVGIVVTVFERDDENFIARKVQWIDKTSCVRFQYNKMTIWIKAYVWAGDEKRKRADKKVSIVCPTIGLPLLKIRQNDIV